MNYLQDISIREIKEKDCEVIARDFLFPWSSLEDSMSKWKKYYLEHKKGVRRVFLCEKDTSVVGYGTLLLNSEYPHFKNSNIPEISDIWIDIDHRRLGLGQTLVSHIENVAVSEGFTKIGIGVGLYQDYGPAQVLYCKLGYIPDGKGITHQCQPITAGKEYPVDDDLILWFTKKLTN